MSRTTVQYDDTVASKHRPYFQSSQTLLLPLCPGSTRASKSVRPQSTVFRPGKKVLRGIFVQAMLTAWPA